MIQKYSYIGNLKLLQTEDSQILIKPKKRYDMETVYKYLEDHHAPLYLKPLEIREEELLFPYLEKPLLNNDELAKKLVYNLSIWQSKTTIHQRLDLDELKKKYEEKKQTVAHLQAYYHDLQDLIETKVQMAPSEYLFIRNVSSLYAALFYADNLLETWYEKMLKTKNERKVYCHGKCELDHFLGNDNGYFISLEKAHIGDVTEDFEHFFKTNLETVDMVSTFRYYQSKYPFTEEEKLSFFYHIVLPNRMEVYPSSLKKCQQLGTFFDHVKMTSDFILEQQEKSKNNQQ